MRPDLSNYGYTQAANERLESLVQFFWRGGRGTASELAKRFNVTKRTINNDIKRLPFLEREGWTYYLPKSYMQLQPYEKAKMSGAMMLAMFEKAVPILSEHAESLFEHMPRSRQIFLFDFAFEPLQNEEVMAQLVSIIDERRGAQFDYTTNQNQTRTRYTFPVKIANFNGYWYLLALDAEADKIKSFRINAMENLTVMEEDPVCEAQKDHWHRKLKDTVSSWIGEETKEVTLRVTGDTMRYFQRKAYDMIEVAESHSDHLLVKVRYFNEMEVLRMVYKRIPDVTIVDDEALKTKMKATLKSALEACG